VTRSTRLGRRGALIGVALGALLVAGCGSDDQQQPSPTSPASVIDGRQGAGENGANNGGKDTGDSVDATPSTAAATADTQEQIGDQSPDGGDSNGLPGATTP
jgi:hypothetical protein